MALKSFERVEKRPHPKMVAVVDAIRKVVISGEKVLVFCHHRAIASELLSVLEESLRTSVPDDVQSESDWRSAWETLLKPEDIWAEEKNRPSDWQTLREPVVDWLCSKGVRRQVFDWMDGGAGSKGCLVEQLARCKPRIKHFRKGKMTRVKTIAEAARDLVNNLLGKESKSTLAVLAHIASKSSSFGGAESHFPGRLDDRVQVMGAWKSDGRDGERLKTLYSGSSDIVRFIFNSPFGPDVLVTTDWLSEGVDLHRYCRHLVHYELDPSPVRTIQRNGRLRRVNSWSSLTGQPICYAYPAFGGTRDERAVVIMRQRMEAFGLLLGGVPSIDEDCDDSGQSFANEVVGVARKGLKALNGKLCVGE